MNHGLSTRSALVRAAETGLRREQRRRESAIIATICIAVLSVYLLVEFIEQVLP